MSSNKAVREELERIYGKKCMMHEGLHINGYKKIKTNYNGKSIAMQLTLHHLKAKRFGGKATIENGAVLCRACHDYLEQSSPSEREKLNNALREYKRNIDYERCGIEFVDDIDLGFEVETAEIEIDDKSKIKAKKLSKAERKRVLRAKKKKEKRELRKELREWEK